MDKLNIALVQTSIYWEDVSKNLEHFGRKIRAIKDQADLIILPEMATTGFSMNPEKLAEGTDGRTVRWLMQLSSEVQCIIIGSFIMHEKKRYYNRLIWMEPSGEFFCYDKRHLFRMDNEHNNYTPGNYRLIKQIGSWRIMPLICYDLRFPVWSRNRNEYDLLVYIANWPASRRDVWQTLLKARALENQAYVVGLNRIGSDGNAISYAGDSVVINPRGVTVSKMKPFEDSTEIVTVSLKELQEFRDRFPVCLDGDDFTIL